MPVRPDLLEDASGFSGHAEAAFAPESEAGVAELLRQAQARGVPVTVAGAGTGVTGGRVAQGGWVLTIEKLQDLEIHNSTAVAGAGVPLAVLQSAAARSRRFYPPDPTETGASIGGTIATNASGSRSFRYGDTRRHVLGLRVALAGGRVLDVRRGDAVDFEVPLLPVPATTKHSAGYRLWPGMDWVDLFVGSEGTLGVILRAELALLPAPGELFAGVVFFPSEDAVLEAVDAWRPAPGLRMLEFLDQPSLKLLRERFSGIPQRAGGALLIEQELDGLDGDEMDRWEERMQAAGALAEASWFAASERDRERFRVFRHALPERVNEIARRNGFQKLGSDYAVPLARNREMMRFYRARLEAEFPGKSAVFGHIGDAHLHVNILPETPAEFERGRALMIEFARKAVELGGTVSAEHGLGKRKAHLLPLQYSPAEIEAMKAVKRRLDPHWLLGRGTLFPSQ